jgi:hypothetical protein
VGDGGLAGADHADRDPDDVPSDEDVARAAVVLRYGDASLFAAHLVDAPWHESEPEHPV